MGSEEQLSNNFCLPENIFVYLQKFCTPLRNFAFTHKSFAFPMNLCVSSQNFCISPGNIPLLTKFCERKQHLLFDLVFIFHHRMFLQHSALISAHANFDSLFFFADLITYYCIITGRLSWRVRWACLRASFRRAVR